MQVIEILPKLIEMWEKAYSGLAAYLQNNQVYIRWDTLVLVHKWLKFYLAASQASNDLVIVCISISI